MQIKQFFLSFLLCLASPDLDPNVSKLQKHAKHERERERERERQNERQRKRERDREKQRKFMLMLMLLVEKSKFGIKELHKNN